MITQEAYDTLKHEFLLRHPTGHFVLVCNRCHLSARPGHHCSEATGDTPVDDRAGGAGDRAVRPVDVVRLREVARGEQRIETRALGGPVPSDGPAVSGSVRAALQALQELVDASATSPVNAAQVGIGREWNRAQEVLRAWAGRPAPATEADLSEVISIMVRLYAGVNERYATLAPWTPDAVATLLDHLQRLTDAVERVEARQAALEQTLIRRGSA